MQRDRKDKSRKILLVLNKTVTGLTSINHYIILAPSVGSRPHDLFAPAPPGDLAFFHSHILAYILAIVDNRLRPLPLWLSCKSPLLEFTF